MAFTRNQAKKQQENIHLQHLQHLQQPRQKYSHHIDFIDASIEWRKNKIKRENSTFEYV